MNYIVFDLEFNQPLSKEQLVLEPFPLCFEVVQIGAVKMDEKCRIQEPIDIMVKPCYYKHIGNDARKRIGIYSKHFQQINVRATRSNRQPTSPVRFVYCSYDIEKYIKRTLRPNNSKSFAFLNYVIIVIKTSEVLNLGGKQAYL